jgi:hypothetical protein
VDGSLRAEPEHAEAISADELERFVSSRIHRAHDGHEAELNLPSEITGLLGRPKAQLNAAPPQSPTKRRQGGGGFASPASPSHRRQGSTNAFDASAIAQHGGAMLSDGFIDMPRRTNRGSCESRPTVGAGGARSDACAGCTDATLEGARRWRTSAALMPRMERRGSGHSSYLKNGSRRYSAPDALHAEGATAGEATDTPQPAAVAGEGGAGGAASGWGVPLFASLLTRFRVRSASVGVDEQPPGEGRKGSGGSRASGGSTDATRLQPADAQAPPPHDGAGGEEEQFDEDGFVVLQSPPLLDSLVIHPNSLFRKRWEALIFTAALIVTFEAPFAAAFLDSTPPAISGIAMPVDLLFVCDVLVKCLTGFVSDDANTLEMSVREIVSNYARSSMLPDVLASVPWRLIGLMVHSADEESLGDFQNFVRIGRLTRCVKVFIVLVALRRNSPTVKSLVTVVMLGARPGPRALHPCPPAVPCRRALPPCFAAVPCPARASVRARLPRPCLPWLCLLWLCVVGLCAVWLAAQPGCLGLAAWAWLPGPVRGCCLPAQLLPRLPTHALRWALVAPVRASRLPAVQLCVSDMALPRRAADPSLPPSVLPCILRLHTAHLCPPVAPCAHAQAT